MTPSQRAAEEIVELIEDMEDDNQYFPSVTKWMIHNTQTIIEKHCGRWHPYPEERPEKVGWYTVTIYGEATTRWWTGVKWSNSTSVLAWKPLDEPYQKEEGHA